MSKTKKLDPATSPAVSNKREKFQDWKNTKWILNNLDESQLAKLDATEFDVGRYMDFMSHLVDNGIEIKFTYDNWSYCYQGTLLGAWEGYPNTGYATSARSDAGFEDIVKILWFKFEYLCHGDMSQAYEIVKKREKRG